MIVWVVLLMGGKCLVRLGLLFSVLNCFIVLFMIKFGKMLSIVWKFRMRFMRLVFIGIRICFMMYFYRLGV